MHCVCKNRKWHCSGTYVASDVVAWSVPSEVGERRGSGQRTLRPDKCDGRDAGEGEHHHGALLLE